MPIVFSCSCGKALKAKEAFAGRKIKCTECGKVLTIPQPDEDESESPVAPPLARPVARPVVSRQRGAALPRRAPVHAWVDQSLAQQTTPWLPGDEERFQKGIRPPREGMGALEKAVVGLAILGGAAAGYFLLINH